MANDIADLILNKMKIMEHEEEAKKEVRIVISHMFLDETGVSKTFKITPTTTPGKYYIDFMGVKFKIDTFTCESIINIITQVILNEFLKISMNQEFRSGFQADYDWLDISVIKMQKEIGKGAFFFSSNVTLDEVQYILNSTDPNTNFCKICKTVLLYVRFAMQSE